MIEIEQPLLFNKNPRKKQKVMLKIVIRLIFAVFGLLALPFQALAIPISPSYTTFGPLPAATFGGTGIPNSAVSVTSVVNPSGGGNLTLGLTAHQRYDNPAVTNDGAGTFFAVTGDDSAHGQPNYARWNFGLYLTGVKSGQETRLYYDTNPAVGNDVSTYLSLGSLGGYQESWNLGMGFLGGAAFPESSSGQYSFALVTFDSQGVEFARSAMIVNVGDVRTSVPDAGPSSALLLFGLGGLGLIKRFKRKIA